MKPYFKQVSVIGVGLLGGSIALAFKKYGISQKIVGVSRNETIKKALQTLENPSTKLAHLLSWFWVIDEYDNLAIDALNNEDMDKAVEIWFAVAQQKDSHHKKNLATIEQILAFRESDADYQHLNNSINIGLNLSHQPNCLVLLQILTRNCQGTSLILRFSNL